MIRRYVATVDTVASLRQPLTPDASIFTVSHLQRADYSVGSVCASLPGSAKLPGETLDGRAT
jgi:hypothetical protein